MLNIFDFSSAPNLEETKRRLRELQGDSQERGYRPEELVSHRAYKTIEALEEKIRRLEAVIGNGEARLIDAADEIRKLEERNELLSEAHTELSEQNDALRKKLHQAEGGETYESCDAELLTPSSFDIETKYRAGIAEQNARHATTLAKLERERFNMAVFTRFVLQNNSRPGELIERARLLRRELSGRMVSETV